MKHKNSYFMYFSLIWKKNNPAFIIIKLFIFVVGILWVIQTQNAFTIFCNNVGGLL